VLTDHVALLATIRSGVAGFPDDFEDRLDEPLVKVFGHGQLQALVHACRAAAPDIAREALLSGATGRDLLAWLERASLATDEGHAFRQGRYESADVRLRPLAEDDIAAIYFASLDPDSAHRWRYRGRTPSPEAFRQSLFTDAILAQFMVENRSDPEHAVGLVSGYNADLVSGHCYIALLRTDGALRRPQSAGLMVEGAILFIQYVFDHFELKKIYVEVPEYNQSLIQGADAVFKKEGDLRDHYVYRGRSWAQYLYACYREDWDGLWAT
jgi:RimJ/RimL family protein N-acetyltransferase